MAQIPAKFRLIFTEFKILCVGLKVPELPLGLSFDSMLFIILNKTHKVNLNMQMKANSRDDKIYN